MSGRPAPIVLAFALTLVAATAAASSSAPLPSATFNGGNLEIRGVAGTRIRVLTPGEKVLGKGRISDAGTLVLKGLAGTDPMQRLVDVDGARHTLSALFPKAELVAVFPRRVGLGLAIEPHVRAVHRGSTKPFAKLPVVVSLTCSRPVTKTVTLGTMVTNEHGVATPGAKPLQLPTSWSVSSCKLAASGAGATVSEPVVVHSGVTLVVSTDRPVYQPGHQVAVRGLVLDANTGAPRAGTRVAIELRSTRGKPLFRRSATTSAFGVVHAVMRVPTKFRDEALVVRLGAGGLHSDKRVKVGRYVTPRVSVSVRAVTRDPKPKQALELAATVSRLDSGPVEGTKVEVTVWDGSKVVFSKRAVADAQGAVTVSGPLGDVSHDTLSIRARAEVPSGDVGKANAEIAVDRGQLVVFAIPESGSLVPGLHNGVWLVTQRPDGSPVAAKVKLRSGRGGVTAQTDADGVGFARLAIPSGSRSLSVVATAGHRSAKRNLRVQRSNKHRGLLRIDPVVAEPGDVVTLRYATAGHGKGLASFDLVQGGQPVRSVATPLVDGVATTTMTIPPRAFGTVTLHAWHLDASGRPTGDTRLALVRDQRDLKVTLTPDKTSYRPRDEATVTIRVTDGRGKPVVAALDLVAVDAGFRALGLEQPGIEQAFARLTKDWQKTRVALPNWAREALYLAEDTKRLSIMAAAAEAVVKLHSARVTSTLR